MKIAGIDSCPLGWIVILQDQNGFSSLAVTQFSELIDLHPDLRRVFIDIPIGLSSEGFYRTVESSMRKQLEKRASTIFTPACREAVYAKNYDAAREINKRVLGKSISIQSHNISKKIKEIDQFFQEKSNALEIYESHPEIVFKYLNDSKVINSKKSTKEGFQERFQLLISLAPELEDLYHSIISSYPKSKVKPDDILDAMALCISNSKSEINNLRFIEDENHTDANGILVKIAY